MPSLQFLFLFHCMFLFLFSLPLSITSIHPINNSFSVLCNLDNIAVVDATGSSINQFGDSEETSLMPCHIAQLLCLQPDFYCMAGITQPSNNTINQNIRVLSICNFLSGLRIRNQMFPTSSRCFSSVLLFLSFPPCLCLSLFPSASPLLSKLM